MTLDQQRVAFAEECRALADSLIAAVDAVYDLRAAEGAEVIEARDYYRMVIGDLQGELDHVSKLARRQETMLVREDVDAEASSESH